MNRPYRFILLDLDGTLLDFEATERVALRRCFETHAVPHNRETVAAYQELNNAMWAACEAGKLSKEQLVAHRFVELLRQLRIERDADDRRLESDYQLALRDGSHLIEGALELCRALAGRYPLYALSNGVAETQNGRLDASNLRRYFAGVFVSGDTGFQKPMPEFFDYCFDRIDGFERRAALLVGDSLTADIRGGQNAGIDTCWFNPARSPLPEDCRPTYEIHALKQLLEII